MCVSQKGAKDTKETEGGEKGKEKSRTEGSENLKRNLYIPDKIMDLENVMPST